MAVKKYIAIADGYTDGRVIKAGEAFQTNFQEVVREESAKGPKGIPAIKRNKDGSPVMRDAKEPPLWARYADEAEYLAAQAADNQVTDPNFDEMTKEALQAYAAERSVPFTAATNKADLITAIKAAKDFTK